MRDVKSNIVKTRLYWLVLLVFCYIWIVFPKTRNEINEISTSDKDNTQSTSEETLFNSENESSLSIEKTNMKCIMPSGKDTLVMNLIFPHVNKAGGRTLEATFRNINLRPKSVFSYISRLPRAKNVEFNLFDGHRYLPRLYQERKCENNSKACEKTTVDVCSRSIFFLREPLQRTLSAFYTQVGRLPKPDKNKLHTEHFLCEKNSLAYNLMQDPNFTFAEYASLPLQEQQKCFEYNSNLHTKYLLGDHNKDLEKAKEVLSKISWFGILEHFEVSLKLFSYTFGITLNSYHPIFNKNLYDKKVSKIEQQVLLNMNQIDIELYQFALKLFWTRIEEMEHDDNFRRVWGAAHYDCSKLIKCWDKSYTNVKVLGKSNSKQERYNKVTELCAPIGGCQLRNLPQVMSPTTTLNFKRDTCLASFAIIGTRKGGTTSLYQYIAAHPQVKGVNLNSGPQSGELLFFRGNHGLNRISSKKVRDSYNAQYIKHLQNQNFDPTYHVTGESSVDVSIYIYIKFRLEAVVTHIKF